jgi:hypothetical protein
MEMIQKTEEGKEVLDNIFLDVALEGARLNAASVGARLNALAKGARDQRTFLAAAGEANRQACQTNLKALKSRFHDFTMRMSWSTRTLRMTQGVLRGRAHMLTRVTEELGNYRKFAAMNNSNYKAWKGFWNTSSAAMKNVAGLVARVRTQVSSLHRQHAQAALVEIPETYANALTEISNEFESSHDNLGGFRPIVANLLEIVRSPVHVRRQVSRRQLRSLLGKLAEQFHDQVNSFAEENEHQDGLFDGMTALLADSMMRSTKLVEGLNHMQDAAAHKVKWLKSAVRGCAHLTDLSRSIVDLTARECRNVNEQVTRSRTRAATFLGVCGQVQEVLNERFGSLKAFFLEKSGQTTN